VDDRYGTAWRRKQREYLTAAALNLEVVALAFRESGYRGEWRDGLVRMATDIRSMVLRMGVGDTAGPVDRSPIF